jgi:hypothetical protein
MRASTVDKGIGKGAHWCSFCRVRDRYTLSNGSFFTKCQFAALGTEAVVAAHWSFLCQAPGQWSLFDEYNKLHSAKFLLPLLVTVTTIFLCRAPDDTRQSLCRVPDIMHSTKRPLSMYSSSSPLYQVSHLTKSLSSIFEASSSTTI